MRLTKIICTLGPSSKTAEELRNLAAAGMNIARINLSHGVKEDHRTLIRTVRTLGDDHCVAIMIDTKGAEIRTGDVSAPVPIAKGQEVVFSHEAIRDRKRTSFTVNYPHFAADARGASRILLDNGALSFDVVSVQGDTVIARAREEGSIGSRRHVNLPGADLQMPSLLDKDWEDLALGVEEKVDFVALSFIRTGEAVREVKKFLRENGGTMLVISKIETQKAVENIDDIIAASDGIMVARGDLGAEIPFERVPAIQDEFVLKCRAAGKPVIVATHMLESMIEHPLPTRAEATDVAHAAMTRADCTMLSGETAAGRHPVTAVEAMDRILRETEARLPVIPQNERPLPVDEAAARAKAAVTMASSMHAPAILVLTRSSRSAHAISQCRPLVPIIALTDTTDVQRQMQILYGVLPLLITFSTNPETTVDASLQAVAALKLLPEGARVVLVSDTKTSTGIVSAVQVRTIPSS